jgi:hypothetical protein
MARHSWIEVLQPFSYDGRTYRTGDVVGWSAAAARRAPEFVLHTSVAPPPRSRSRAAVPAGRSPEPVFDFLNPNFLV